MSGFKTEKKRKGKPEHMMSSNELMSMIRREMPPPSRAHQGLKYKRDKSWKLRDIENDEV